MVLLLRGRVCDPSGCGLQRPGPDAEPSVREPGSRSPELRVSEDGDALAHRAASLCSVLLDEEPVSVVLLGDDQRRDCGWVPFHVLHLAQEHS